MSIGAGGDARPRRLFLAVFPLPDVQANVHRVTAPLRAAEGGLGVSWVRESNLHFTLRFLGDCEATVAEAATAAMQEAASGHTPFEVRLGALGAFPDAMRARVLWAGLEVGEARLGSLAESLAESLERRGFPRESRPFAPHLTLGRVREPEDWSGALQRQPPLGISFDVTQLLLVDSTLLPGGSRYGVAARAKLAG